MFASLRHHKNVSPVFILKYYEISLSTLFFVVVLISNSTVVHGVIFCDSLVSIHNLEIDLQSQLIGINFLFITTFISFLLKDPIRIFLNRQNQQSQEQ